MGVPFNKSIVPSDLGGSHLPAEPGICSGVRGGLYGTVREGGQQGSQMETGLPKPEGLAKHPHSSVLSPEPTQPLLEAWSPGCGSQEGPGQIRARSPALLPLRNTQSQSAWAPRQVPAPKWRRSRRPAEQGGDVEWVPAGLSYLNNPGSLASGAGMKEDSTALTYRGLSEN